MAEAVSVTNELNDKVTEYLDAKTAEDRNRILKDGIHAVFQMKYPDNNDMSSALLVRRYSDIVMRFYSAVRRQAHRLKSSSEDLWESLTYAQLIQISKRVQKCHQKSLPPKSRRKKELLEFVKEAYPTDKYPAELRSRVKSPDELHLVSDMSCKRKPIAPRSKAEGAGDDQDEIWNELMFEEPKDDPMHTISVSPKSRKTAIEGILEANEGIMKVLNANRKNPCGNIYGDDPIKRQDSLIKVLTNQQERCDIVLVGDDKKNPIGMFIYKHNKQFKKSTLAGTNPNDPDSETVRKELKGDEFRALIARTASQSSDIRIDELVFVCKVRKGQNTMKNTVDIFVSGVQKAEKSEGRPGTLILYATQAALPDDEGNTATERVTGTFYSGWESFDDLEFGDKRLQKPIDLITEKGQNDDESTFETIRWKTYV